MKCQILHETGNRLRVHMIQNRMTMDQADILEAYLKRIPGICETTVNDRTANVIIRYNGERKAVINALAVFQYEENAALIPEHSGRQLSREYEDRLLQHVLKRGISRFLLPLPIRSVITAVKAVRFIVPGVKSLLSGKLEVSVLDAISIGVSLQQGNFDTAGDIMFLLGMSEILEEWTHKKSVDDLARSMALNVDKVWMKTDDGVEVLVSVADIEEGDRIVVRTGNVIPLDGVVEEGEALVNQASLTGESLPVRKKEGAYAYAGTVLEEGELIITVKNAAGSGRYDSIVKMIEESSKLMSDSENRASALADRLVPWCLGATGLTYLLTRNVTRAMAVLMVDFSCALKLSMPIAVLSAMREASNYQMSVKGGKYLELAAKADTIVFDKTGTLTCSVPTVAKIITFGRNDEDEMLRLAACLEEHYPHSIANAVVEAARQRGLEHAEKHTKVEYVVAHGIASHIDGKKVIIGSYHFVFEDEKTNIPVRDQEKFDHIPPEYSHLYMAVGGRLTAVICIEDPLRRESAEVIRHLKKLGIKHTVMLTGDNEKTASVIAEKVGVDTFVAEVLPQDKADYVKKMQSEGHTVIMIGDGINDTPALSSADVALAISNGAAVAREIADITVPGEDLMALVRMRELAEALMRRIRANYRFIMGFNSGLIVLGMLGILQPSVTAYLHNFSTLGLSLNAMTNVLDNQEQ